MLFSLLRLISLPYHFFTYQSRQECVITLTVNQRDPQISGKVRWTGSGSTIDFNHHSHNKSDRSQFFVWVMSYLSFVSTLQYLAKTFIYVNDVRIVNYCTSMHYRSAVKLQVNFKKNTNVTQCYLQNLLETNI